MKKIFLALITAAASLSFAGCDSLDIDSVSTITDAGYWKSADQIKAFNTGLHGLTRKYSYNMFMLGEPRADIYGDIPFGGEATQGVERLPYNTINAEFTGISDFGKLYTVINQINLMIYKIKDTDLVDESTRNYYLGEAYGLRAFLYFHLLRSWGDVIITTEPTLGDQIDVNNLAKAASPASEVLDQIKKDIESSEKAFGDDYSYKYGKYYWSKAATQMLKGEVYMWSGSQMGGGNGDYTTAKAALESVKQNAAVSLESEFTSVFAYDNKLNKEIIFAYHSGQDDDFLMWEGYNWRNNMVPQKEYMANYCTEDGTPYLKVSGFNLNGLIRYQVNYDFYWKVYRDRDTRKEGTLLPIYKQLENGTTEYVAPIAYKFRGMTLAGGDERQWYDDYPIYRYADCLLLLAQAKAFLGEDISSEINAIRERAYGSEYFNAHKSELAYPNDKGAFYTDNKYMAGDDKGAIETVLKERLREFVFEGKRWYDLRCAGTDYVLKYTRAQKERLLWPINESVLTNNTALKQTPGY
ncbi:SusD family outer membrane lipoprotein NanU [Parabacteroides distasonis]|uniref:SusD family outer membrane lipoprotein NanU n=1 Tax=Parabacteroides distasonis TaxID=823 RepID=UPI00308B0E3A|nr:SusD family outer membrane lipoprotein NanU [Parabacteroides distasonis]